MDNFVTKNYSGGSPDDNVKKMEEEFPGGDSDLEKKINEEIEKLKQLQAELRKSQSELERLKIIQGLRKGQVNNIDHNQILLAGWGKDFSNDQQKKDESIKLYEMMKKKYNLESKEDLESVNYTNGRGTYKETTKRIREIYSDPETGKKYKVIRVSVHGDSWTTIAESIHDDVLRIKIEEI